MSPRGSRGKSTNPVLPPGPNALFVGRDPDVRETYERLASALRAVGQVSVESKRTSIHLMAGFNGSTFAGVHPQKKTILLDLCSAAPIVSSRVRKVEQVSKNRFQNELLLASPDDVNGELLGWLRQAYELASRAG